VIRSERLPPAHVWWRIADAAWADPLDPTFAARGGARWNPPASFPTLYLNEDRVTARLNLRLFVAGWPYEPEDLRDDTGPVLVGARLPRDQQVADAHTREGVLALGLPASYPLDVDGNLIPHAVCQPLGAAVLAAGYRGVRCRSARVPEGAGRELAWFPARSRSRAQLTARLPFGSWYFG
jgi:hypothetical protein